MPLYGFKSDDHWAFLKPAKNPQGMGILVRFVGPDQTSESVKVTPANVEEVGLGLIQFLKEKEGNSYQSLKKWWLGGPEEKPHDAAYLRTMLPPGYLQVVFPSAYMTLTKPVDVEGFVEAWLTLGGMEAQWHAYTQWKTLPDHMKANPPMLLQKYGIKPPLTEKEAAIESATFAAYDDFAMKYKVEYSDTVQKFNQAVHEATAEGLGLKKSLLSYEEQQQVASLNDAMKKASDDFKGITAILKEANKKVAKFSDVVKVEGPTPVATQPVRQFEDIDEKAPPLVVKATQDGATLSVTPYTVSLTPPQIEKLILALNAVPQETSMTSTFVALEDDHQIRVQITGKAHLSHPAYATVKIAAPGSLAIFTKEKTQALAAFLLQVLIERE